MRQFFNKCIGILQSNPWDDNNDRPQSSWGRGGNRGRSGGGGGSDMPPDFEEFFRKGQESFKRAMPGGFDKNGFKIIGFIILVFWLASGFYSVAGGEKCVVLRFGQFNRTTEPGLRYALPWPIERVLKPNVQLVNQIDVGFPTVQRGQNAGFSPESQMLTQDKNILNMHYRIQWRIQDAPKFLFNIRDPQATIRAAGESVMREFVGQMRFDDIVRGGREKLSLQVKEKLQQTLDYYQAGVLIIDVLPQKIDPPTDVIDAFNDVQRAEQDAEKEINLAEAYKSDIVPRAKGEAERMRLEAEAYKERSLRDAEGEAQRFISVLNAFRTAGDVTKDRMYFETMQEVFRNSNKIIVDNRAGAVPYLPVQEMAEQARRNRENLKPNQNNPSPLNVPTSVGAPSTGERR